MKTHHEIAELVRESRERIASADPGAYSGFVTDAACRAVAKREGMKATDVVRAYRSFYPSGRGFFPLQVGLRTIPRDARQPSDEAKAAA